MSPDQERRRGQRHAPGTPTEKPENFRQAWSRLFRYMGRYRAWFVVAVILAVMGTALTLLGPNVLSDITNIIKDGLLTGDIDLEGIAALGFWLAAIYGISAAISLVQGLIMATVAQRTAGSLREDISRKIDRVPLGYFDSAKSGDLMSRVTNDADSLGQDTNRSVSTMIVAITQFLGSLLMMMYTNLTLAGVAVGSTAFGFVLMVLIMSRSQKHFEAQQNHLGAMNGHITETYNSHSIVKSYNGDKRAKREFDQINEDLRHSGFMAMFMAGTMMPLMNFIGNFGYVMVCIVGAMMVLDGSVTIGTIVAFMIYIRLFTNPLQQMSQGLTVMQSVAAASERIFGFLDEPELEDESRKAGRIHAKGHVEFRDVRFSYVPGKEIIHGFSADIKPGQKVAIVGPTGAGKTTMVNLLMRFYEVDSGDILIDGVSVKDLTRENVHEQFCMVLQDSWLFEGSIRENLVYSREGISQERIEEVCKAVGVHHFITTLPEGYDTVIADNDTLSAGQRQQLTIARAMLDTSPMLILDEATSSVDTRTEQIIQQAMDSLARERTSFVIAHRLSTIRNSDLIIVMRNGSVVEQGTHDELLAKGGFYQDLYDSQFEETDMG
ncbi:MAG: ABC transporter ATP-binding protein [Candidatus Methanomethylophilaceae archaeon]|nr:ABC transporter ATP-binding protein [Candidatus Methanomethylophilaceae archaeon]